jgi:hypothetical protein
MALLWCIVLDILEPPAAVCCAATTGVSDYKTTGMSDITQWQEIMIDFRETTLNHD